MGISHRLDLVLRIIEQGSDKPLIGGLNEFWVDAYPVRPSRVSGSFYIFSDLEKVLGKPLEFFETLTWQHVCYQKMTINCRDLVKNEQTQEVLLRAQPSPHYPCRFKMTGVRLSAVADQLYYKSRPEFGHELLRLMLMADALPGQVLKIAQPGRKDLSERILLLEEGEKREVVVLTGGAGTYEPKKPLILKFTQEAQLTELFPLKQTSPGVFETYFELENPRFDIEFIAIHNAILSSKNFTIEKGCLNDLGAL